MPERSHRLVIMREGHGGAGAVENLAMRVNRDRGLLPAPFASLPPTPGFLVDGSESAVRAASIASWQNPGAVLLTADLDDGCPAALAPDWAAAVALRHFSVEMVLFHREFEFLALSVADDLAGRELRSPAGKLIPTIQNRPPLHETPSPPATPEAGSVSTCWVACRTSRPSISCR